MSGKPKQKKNAAHREDSSPQSELALAARKFLPAAKRDSRLKLLLLIDPIHAFADAGILLSKRAAKLLRRRHPEVSYSNEELYSGVKSGAVRLSWIERIELGDPCVVEGTTESDSPTGRKE